MAGDQAVGQGHVEQHHPLTSRLVDDTMQESAQPGNGGRAWPSAWPAIDRIEVHVLEIPTTAPESDGTLVWCATTMILVEVGAGGESGLGYTYSHAAAARVVAGTLAQVIRGRDPMAVGQCWHAMWQIVRNDGAAGIAASAIAAVDIALWDLKARLLALPLVDLLGAVRPGVPLYGSGGFTSLSIDALQEQLRGWVDAGIPRVKMKVGRGARAEEEARVRAARDAIGPRAALFVDANGAYTRKQALDRAELFCASQVSWFEEPVSSDDLAGLRLMRDRAPAGMQIAAGEYAYDAFYARRMIEAGAVDVLQADVTRCMGISGLLQVNALCAAWCMPLSLHTAPTAHLHAGASLSQVIHLEYFHDHVRIERQIFEGLPEPRDGLLCPDRGRPGHGVTFCRGKAEQYAI